MYVCLCYSVTDARIREAVRQGARDVGGVGRLTGAGTDCGQCRERLAAMIDEVAKAAAQTDGGRET